jgi:hypothetical protein
MNVEPKLRTVNVEPKLRKQCPAQWVGGVTLIPEEAKQVVQLLPNGPLRGELQQTLEHARARGRVGERRLASLRPHAGPLSTKINTVIRRSGSCRTSGEKPARRQRATVSSK